MRHGKKTKKLGRTAEHRRSLLRNLARALFINGQIRTTLAKAKFAQQFVERLISHSIQDCLATRRLLFAELHDHELVKMVVEKIGPLFAKRPGGYTRIWMLGPRLGDGAEMAILALVERPAAETPEKGKEKKKEEKPKQEAREPKAPRKTEVKKEEKKEKKEKPAKKEKPKPKGADKKA
jgi:large subunit ribosomal protein L17